MKLPGGSNYHLLVKYSTPESSLSSFAEKINLQAGGWPSTLCGQTRAVVTAYDYNSNIIGTSNATVVSGNFETDMSSSGYTLSCSRGESKTFDLRYTIRINGGPEREIRPYSGTHVEVYNGFRALPPITIEEKDDPFVVAGQYKTLMAVILPNPASNAGFTYQWYAVKIGGGQGEGSFNQGDLGAHMTRFMATCPGEYNVSYRAAFNGETETSGNLKIKVGPEIFIDNPLENNQKYCFNQNGELIILAEGHTNPEENGEDLVWDISPVDGTNLTTDPSDRQGTLVEFDLNGLPPSNDAFGDNNGKNWIKASVPIENCTIESLRPIMLFYLSDAYYVEDDGYRVPNWYHYWKQGAVSNLHYLSYTEAEATGAYDYRGMNEFGYPIEALYIGFTGDGEGPDFNNIDPYFPQYMIPSGVDNSANISKHELKHQYFYHQWMPPDGEWYVRFGAHPRITDPETDDPTTNPNDKDGDMIPNIVEMEYNRQYGDDFRLRLSINECDSYSIPNYEGLADQEIMCRIAAWNETGDASKDWSRGEFAKNWPSGN